MRKDLEIPGCVINVEHLSQDVDVEVHVRVVETERVAVDVEKNAAAVGMQWQSVDALLHLLVCQAWLFLQ
jgi:hypothetical protein